MRIKTAGVLFSAGFVALLSLSGAPASAQADSPAGFYLRGDIGSGVAGRIVFRDANPTAANCDLCNGTFPSPTAASALVDAGVGYRLTPYFRTELSVGYLIPASINGQTVNIPPAAGSAHFASAFGLLNGYLDLDGLFPGQFGPFQPYLSASAGVARNHLGITSGTSSLLGPFTLSSGDTTSFIWALGAGVGYPLSPSVTADLGYHFMNLGELRDGATLTFSGGPLALTRSKSDYFAVNAVTLGLRFGL